MADMWQSEVVSSRLTEDYLVNQINGFRGSKQHIEHKQEIQNFDRLYAGDLNSLFPDEDGLSDTPLVENKLKNATHDIMRLANEAKGTPVFMREGEAKADRRKSAMRAQIAQTIWKMGKGPRIEGKLYLDLISAGFAALSVYYNDRSDYPQFLRLNPRFCYPDVVNGELQTLMYIETMKEREAARLWPEAGLNSDIKNKNEVYVTMYFDDKETCQYVSRRDKNGNARDVVGYVSHWEHNLGRVPVAFQMLPSADDTFHGLFNQLGGPMMIRNKVVRLLSDYLESMAHAPFERKNILNGDDEPGPLTVYEHDPNSDQSFMRRVAPAAPAGAVFGLLQYMDSQESAEAIQPPARVGVVSQSIASGSFVASTQGTLSSVVKELQEIIAELRYEADCIAFKIDAEYLDREKPLYQAVGNKQMYTPSKDMGTFHYHSITYGASAGLNRSEADVRVLQHLGAKLISKETGRAQLDFIDDTTIEQDLIDQEELASAFFQRFATDPATPQSVLAKALVEMGKGKSFLEVVEVVQPELFAQEQAAAAAAAGPQGPEGMPVGPEGVPPEAQQAALEAGQTTGGPEGITPELAPPPMSQVVTRNPVF